MGLGSGYWAGRIGKATLNDLSELFSFPSLPSPQAAEEERRANSPIYRECRQLAAAG